MILIPKIPLDKTEQKHFTYLILTVFCFFFLSVCISVSKIIVYEKTEATVIEDYITTPVRGGSIEHVIVSYTCNGYKYNANIKLPLPNKLKKGQILEIYYHPENHDVVLTISNLLKIPMILLIVDILLLVVYLFGSEKI